MNKPEIALYNQIKNINLFIQGITHTSSPILLNGIRFNIKDIKKMTEDAELNTSYVVLDIESLRRENQQLRERLGE